MWHRYYVRPSSKPPKRAAIALAVKVGSVVENDEESGVAHILEHLAFNATKSFENHAIIAFLESIGSEFGACQVCAVSQQDANA
jgi:predicted Zn-dependent peptidase